MDFLTWEDCTLSDAYIEGHNTLYSLICDYQKAIKDYGLMSVDDFIQTWTAIRWKDFERLKKGDIVYNYTGNKYQCIEGAFLSNDTLYLRVECTKVTDNNKVFITDNNTELFTIGDLYFAPNYTRLAEYRHKILEREEIACPILITKTKQLQS